MELIPCDLINKKIINKHMKNSATNLFRKTTISILAFVIVMLFGTNIIVKGQTVASYTFTQGAGTYTAIAGTSILAGSTDDGVSALTNIGFTFNYHCVNYTQFAVESNGFIILGAATTAMSNPLTSVADCISFAGGDGKTNTGVYYLLSGTAPNRVLTIDYPNWYVYYSSTTETLSAQIKLYETTNVIEIIYGPSAHATSYTRQTGITGAAVTDYNIRTTTTDWAASTAGTANSATMTWSSTVFPANGLKYTWTPSTVCSGTPVPGNTVSSSNPVCPSATFTLSMSGTAAGCGTTCQWQSSTNGTTWTNISGATSATYTSTQTADTYYQCLVTCTNSGLSANSTSLYVTMNTNPSTCLLYKHQHNQHVLLHQ